MANDEAKRLILARRARFVAAAVAGIAAACGGATDDTKPTPCLEPVIRDSGADADPKPCLTPLPPDASSDAGGDAASDADTGVPQPCLSQLPPDAGDGG
jgi:hypothetical protein